MRINIVPGIIVVLMLLLQGCGHKGPLTLPASQPQTQQSQSSQPQPSNSPDPQTNQ